MSNPGDKREFERHCTDAPMRFGLMHSTDGIPAVLSDYGEGGIGFRSHRPLKEGAVVYIRLQTPGCFPAGCPQPRSVCLAQIRWCREDDEGREPGYAVGAKYI